MTAREDPLPSADAAGAITPEILRQIEIDLSDIRYRDIPIAPTLNDFLVVEFLWGHTEWGSRVRWLNRAARARHLLRPPLGKPKPVVADPHHILVTWQERTPRLDDMLDPVVREIGADRCVVMLGDDACGIPADVATVVWDQAIGPQLSTWRAEYRLCRPFWHRRLREVCEQYGLPKGALELLSLRLMIASQWIEGCLRFLADSTPSLVLTEYDRNYRWSCLILAARRLGIPTITLVHGVIRPDAIGFSPVLADQIVCWGRSDVDKLAAAGEPLEKLAIGGCPRLTRTLPCSTAEARRRLGIAHHGRVALLATSPDRNHLALAELFCASIEANPDVSGVVRLHPAERPSDYADIAHRYPRIRFMENGEGTLDECLSAADVVVVRGSGVGNDALLKGLPVIVLSPGPVRDGNEDELVNLAGCPLAMTTEEFQAALREVGDETSRHEHRSVTERYVADFCSAYGSESARLIADIVDRALESTRHLP